MLVVAVAMGVTEEVGVLVVMPMRELDEVSRPQTRSERRHVVGWFDGLRGFVQSVLLAEVLLQWVIHPSPLGKMRDRIARMRPVPIAREFSPSAVVRESSCRIEPGPSRRAEDLLRYRVSEPFPNPRPPSRPPRFEAVSAG